MDRLFWYVNRFGKAACSLPVGRACDCKNRFVQNKEKPGAAGLCMSWKSCVRCALAALCAAAWLTIASFAAREEAQPVFFSLLFPQLMPGDFQENNEEMTPGEAVAL